jgi:hypothetical protein
MPFVAAHNRRLGQHGQTAWIASASAFVAVTCLLAATADGQTPPPKKVRRATPPPPTWDRITADTFYDDAFTVLEGQRPTFRNSPQPAGRPTGNQPQAEAEKGSGTGFKWSSLVSEETLTDEIKDMKAVASAAVARPSDFKGGGYDKAREAFSSIALAFGVIAAHDQDVRWKKDAVTARDLFARVGFNCKVGTDQSFSESKARVADLESLLDGGSPQGKPDRDEDFLWSQVAARPALMSRLEAADEATAAAAASKGDFDRQLDRLVHEAEMVAVIGEVIQQRDFEYHDDETYRGYAAAMRDAAIKARDAARKKDYDAARSAVGELKKSCDSCHGDYRS